VKRQSLLVLALAASMAAATNVSCSALVHVPKVIQAIDVTVQVIDAIDKFAADLFAVQPDAELQKTVKQAIARARIGLQAGKDTLQGVENVSQAKYLEAFAEFRAAYEQVLALLGPLGLQTKGGEMRARAAPGGGLMVPPANELPIKA
jgi:hypothetical protein